MHSAEKSQVRVNALYASRVPLLGDLRATEVKLQIEDRKEAILANFQVRPVLIDRILAAQMEDEEVQKLI